MPIAIQKVTSPEKVNQADKEIDQAIHRVYQIYGPDLSAFSRAIHKQLKLERLESTERQRYLESLKRA